MASTALYIRDYRAEIPGEMTETEWRFPIINSVNAHGRATFWQIYVRVVKRETGEVVPLEDQFFDSNTLMPGLVGYINVDSGLVGGKTKKSTPTFVSAGKNLGKASATNVWTQALRDAYGLYNKQARKSNAPKRVSTTELFPPMLAQVLSEQAVAPVVSATSALYLQRKYNGVRCITALEYVGNDNNDENARVIMYSRRKNLYPGFVYIKEELLSALQIYWEAGRKLYLDGEIYKHGAALQDISGNARREDQSIDIKYDYMIYDCFLPDEPRLIFSERHKLIDDIFSDFAFTYAKAVETDQAHSMDEVEALYRQYLDEGYEGAMVRVDASYHYSYNERHSKVLLKMKPTHDAEYEIVGWTTGEKGKAAAALMIICTAEGKRFPVTPAMEIPDRNALAKKMSEVEPNLKTHFENHWLGRPLIVYFDEKSKDGLPQRARTKMEIRTWQ